MTGTPFDTLGGLEVREDACLAWSKVAVMVGEVVYLSPAMMSLVRAASPDDLRRLLGAIRVVRLPDPADYMKRPLPMTTRPPGSPMGE